MYRHYTWTVGYRRVFTYTDLAHRSSKGNAESNNSFPFAPGCYLFAQTLLVYLSSQNKRKCDRERDREKPFGKGETLI